MTSMLHQVMVDFAGDGAGTGELSWGQKENWHRIVELRIWAPLGGVNPLPPGATLDDMTDTLRYLMSRHQSLRTRIRLDDGRPVQVVFGSGEIPLEIVDAGDDADPAVVAESVTGRYRDTPMDFTAEWPLRTAVIRHLGQLTHVVTLVSHLATDAGGIVLMMAELAARTSTPVDGMPPLAQAAWQRSPAGRRHNEAALRYWDSILRTIEPHRFHEQPEHSPRYWHGEFTSPVLLPAVRAISDRSGLGTSTVFLALFAVALTEVTGINPVVMRPIVSNRFRPGLAGVVCTVAQAGLCVLDVAGVPFDEALRRVQRSVINAYKYAYFDHEDMVALRQRVERERGTAIDTRCFLNDRHGVLPNGMLSDARPGEFRWVRGQDDPPFERLFVEIDDVPDAIRVTLHLDTRSISLADAEALARGIETTALTAADLLERQGGSRSSG
jgi:hypothetical protein